MKLKRKAVRAVEIQKKKKKSGSVDRPGGPYPRAYMGTTPTWRAKPETHANVITRAGLDWDGRIWLNIIAKNLFQMLQWFLKSRKEGFKTNSRHFQKTERKKEVCVLVRKSRYGKTDLEIKMLFTSFKIGLVFTCTHWAGGFAGRWSTLGFRGRAVTLGWLMAQSECLSQQSMSTSQQPSLGPPLSTYLRVRCFRTHSLCAIILSKPTLRGKDTRGITTQSWKLWRT